MPDGTTNRVHRPRATGRCCSARGRLNAVSRRRPSQVLLTRKEPNLSQPPQILLRLLHIPPDLLFQSFDGRKLDLIAQAIEEMKFDFRFRRAVERMKIQEASF